MEDDRERSVARNEPCPMCGSREQPIYVHGHSQCATCKVNIDPCGGGAPPAELDVA